MKSDFKLRIFFKISRVHNLVTYFYRIQNKATARLNHAGSNVINCCDSDHKTISVIRNIFEQYSSMDRYLKYEYSFILKNSVMEYQLFTYFPVHVPSTSVKSICRTVSISCGPKYLGCKRISCSSDICNSKNKQAFKFEVLHSMNITQKFV